MSVISGAIAAHKQGNAAQDAANWQSYMGEFAQKLLKQGDDRAIAYQQQGWNKAQSDLSPYLDMGSRGLNIMTSFMPQYLNKTLAPMANDIINSPNALPDAGFGFNPITGEKMGAGDNVDLSGSGVLSPDTPSVQQTLKDYRFNPDDPVYQQKLSEKNEEIDKFLAKQGLQGSSAGESFRQRELDKLRASEDQRQYSRAVDIAQAGVQDYGMQASRGDTLFNRLYGQESDRFNRQTQTALNDFSMDQQKYGIAKDIYNAEAQRGMALAGMGQNASSQSSSQNLQAGQNMGGTAMQTGANRANIAMGVGDARAQGALAQGQAWGGYAQNVGNTLVGLGTAGLMGGYFNQPNYYQYPQYSPGYY